MRFKFSSDSVKRSLEAHPDYPNFCDRLGHELEGRSPEPGDDFSITVVPSSESSISAEIVSSDASGEYRYLAFISYSHSNEDWGTWIQKSLETFRVPSRLAGCPNQYGEVPKKVFPVFRDRDELSASAELSDSIQQALEDTRFLLVICSRESAQSHWVNQEIKLFKSFAGSNRVLCLIVDGEPHAENPEDECFPEAVKYEVTRQGELTDIPCEPMAADARAQGDGKFNAQLKILAALLGVRYDDLRQREKVRLRRKRILNSVLASILLVVVATSFILFRQHSINERNHRIAVNLIDTLATGSLGQAVGTLDRIAGYRAWAEPELRLRYQAAGEGTLDKYRLGLGLLVTDTEPLDYLRDHSLSLDVHEVAVVSELLHPFGDQLASYYEEAVENDNLPAAQRLVAASFLVGMAPDSSLWSEASLAEFITERLLLVQPIELESFERLFHPKRELLIEPLTLAYAAESQGDIERLYAKSYLLDYCQDSPEQLFELLTLSPPEYFQEFFALLERFQGRAVQLGLDHLVVELEESESDTMVIRRQANIGLLLIKMGQQDSVWPVLQTSPNPSVRTHLIHWLAQQDVPPESLFEQYRIDSRPDVKHSLLLALGEYDESQISATTRQGYSEVLLKDYVGNPDSGVHGAIDWLLRRWGFAEEVAKLDQQLAGESDPQRQWYVNGQGQSFAIITGGTFQKGAPKWSEYFGEYGYETYVAEIDRIYAIGTKEISRAEWRLFSAENEDVWQADNESILAMSPQDFCTMKGITWYEAARYCNWLSQREGIPEDQWCFEPNAEGKYAEGMKARENFLELEGYRLPTDAEIEFAARSKTRSLWEHGNLKRWIGKYGYCPSGTSCYPSGLLKPNGFGLFDLIGNGANWVHNIDLPRHKEENVGKLSPAENDRVKKIQSGQRILDRPIQQSLFDTTSRLFFGNIGNNGFVFYFSSCHVNDRILDINLSLRLARTIMRE